MVVDFIKDWGPESLLALVVFLLIMGWLVPRRNHDKEMLRQQRYYEERIDELEKYHSVIIEHLRATQDTTQNALMQSVHNTQRLVEIANDFADLTRVATPALVVRQEVLEGRHDPTPT